MDPVDLERVKNVIRQAPKGLTVTDVAERLQISRNSAAKYLEMMSVAGEVEMRTFGRAKIYRLSDKVPTATVLSLSSELIALIDDSLQVIDVNDQFLHFTGLARKEIEGHLLDKLDVDLLAHRDILLNVRDALRGKEYFQEISVARGNEKHFFSIKLIPLAARDNRRMIALVYRNITARKNVEIALRESEARYRAVVEDQSDMIIRILPDRSITFANAVFCRYIGEPLERLMGLNLMGYLASGNRDKISADLDSIRFEKPALTEVHDLRMRGGRRLWMQFTYRGIFDDRRQLREYQIVGRDVSGLKHAEIALQESEEKFRAAFDQSPIGACIMSLEYRFLRVNPEFSRITGYREEELKSKTFLELTHPEDRDADASLAGELVAGRTGQYHLEKRLICKNGRTIWLRKHARLVIDSSGVPVYYLSLFEDITEHREMERSLQITQFAMDNATEGILWAGSDGRLTYVNHALGHMLGYTREELTGMMMWDINPTYDPEKWRQRYRESMSSPLLRFESVHRARNGTLIPVEVAVNCLRIMGEDYYCAFVRDIPGRKPPG